jgi:predicted SAM-dependent methyltransferase
MKNLAHRLLRSRSLKFVARPLTAPMRFVVVRWSRAGLAPRLDELDRQAQAARAELDGMDRYVPVILSSIQAQNAMTRTNARTYDELGQLVRSTLDRFEALRDETLAEVRRLGGTLPPPFVEAKVLNPDKVDASRGRLRLHLGTDHGGSPDHVHFDPRALDGVDVVGDVRDLPFEHESVAEIYSEHLVGSFSPDALAGDVLPHWFSVLAPEGTVVAVVGDLDALLREYISGGVPFDDLKRAVFGSSDQPNRIASFSADDLAGWFTAAGFTDVSVRPRSGHGYELEVAGRKPAPIRGS